MPRIKVVNPLFNTDGTITARPCTISHLSEIYGVTYKTMSSWLRPFLDELGAKVSIYYTIVQVELIFEKLGVPKNWDLQVTEPNRKSQPRIQFRN